MHLSQVCLVALATASAQAQETVLGVYIFSRHGDRTPKSLPPANLTDLGYQEIYTSGQYFRSRYIASNASHKIAGMNADIVKQSQISVSAPVDTVLQNSAQGTSFPFPRSSLIHMHTFRLSPRSLPTRWLHPQHKYTPQQH